MSDSSFVMIILAVPLILVSATSPFLLRNPKVIIAVLEIIWVKVFRNGPSKICGRQLSKNFKECGLPKGCLPQILLGPFLNTLSHIYLFFIHSNVTYLTNFRVKLKRYDQKLTDKREENVNMKIYLPSHENAILFMQCKNC